MITSEDITLLPRRYAIGKRPLSLLLGWGELTYTRLIEGNTPTTQHAEELRKLCDDPVLFARLLQTGRERVTDMAYQRSMRAIDELLVEQGGVVRATRIFAVADRFCTLAEGDLTPNALQCLMYFAQGRTMLKGSPALFDDLPRAAASGPLYDRIAACYTFDEIQRVSAAAGETADSADEAKDVKADKMAKPAKEAKKAKGAKEPEPVEDAASSAESCFDVELTSEELKLVDAIYERYGAHSGQVLSQMSKETTPWAKARKRAGEKQDDENGNLITTKSMAKYFAKKK